MSQSRRSSENGRYDLPMARVCECVMFRQELSNLAFYDRPQFPTDQKPTLSPAPRTVAARLIYISHRTREDSEEHRVLCAQSKRQLLLFNVRRGRRCR